MVIQDMADIDEAQLVPIDTHIITYRYLRGGMGLLVLTLGIAVIGERVTATCWQTSISAYYFTTAHAIFIAALCAIGVLLIVYRPISDAEDLLLDLAGVLAFFVAMVPTGRPGLLCGPSDLPADYQVGPGTTNNIWAVFGSLVAAQALLWWTATRTPNRRRLSPLGIVVLAILWLVVAVAFVAFIGFRDQFNSYAHGVSASIMFLAITTTVVTTAFWANRQDTAKSPHRKAYALIYCVIAVSMLATLVGVIALHLALHTWNYWVISIETLLIAEFTAFWVVQTVELWSVRGRFDLLTPQDQRKVARARSSTTRAATVAPLAEGAQPEQHSLGDKVVRAL